MKKPFNWDNYPDQTQNMIFHIDDNDRDYDHDYDYNYNYNIYNIYSTSILINICNCVYCKYNMLVNDIFNYYNNQQIKI